MAPRDCIKPGNRTGYRSHEQEKGRWSAKLSTGMLTFSRRQTHHLGHVYIYSNSYCYCCQYYRYYYTIIVILVLSLLLLLLSLLLLLWLFLLLLILLLLLFLWHISDISAAWRHLLFLCHRTGLVLSSVVPSPSCPRELQPKE